MMYKVSVATCLIIASLTSWSSCDDSMDDNRWVPVPIIIDPVESQFSFDKDGFPYLTEMGLEHSKTAIKQMYDEVLNHTWEGVAVYRIKKDGTLAKPEFNYSPNMYNYLFKDDLFRFYCRYDEPKANGFYDYKVDFDPLYGDFYVNDTIDDKVNNIYEIVKHIEARIVDLTESDGKWNLDIVIELGREYPKLLDCVGTPYYGLISLKRINDNDLNGWLKDFPNDYNERNNNLTCTRISFSLSD